MTKDGYMGQLIEDMMDLGTERSVSIASQIGLAVEIMNHLAAEAQEEVGDGKDSLREHLRETMATDDQPRIPVCPECGSAEITNEARVRWDPDAQDWVIARVFEAMGVSCEGCGYSYTSVVWRMAEDVEVGEEPSDPEGQSDMDDEYYGTLDPETGAWLKHGEVQF